MRLSYLSMLPSLEPPALLVQPLNISLVVVMILLTADAVVDGVDVMVTVSGVGVFTAFIVFCRDSCRCLSNRRHFLPFNAAAVSVAIAVGALGSGRHDEEDRRIAREFEEQRMRAKMANSRLKQLVSVEEKVKKGAVA